MTREYDLKNPTLTDDNQGGRTAVHAVVGTVWANVIPLPAARALSYGMVMNNRPHELDMHWEEDAYTLDEDSILVDKISGQVLYVHSVLNADMESYRAKVLCTEKR